MSYVSHHVARDVGSRTSRHDPAAGVTVRVRIVPEPLPSDPDVLAGLVREAFPRASSISVTRASPGRLAVVHRAVVDGVRYYLRRAVTYLTRASSMPCTNSPPPSRTGRSASGIWPTGTSTSPIYAHAGRYSGI